MLSAFTNILKIPNLRSKIFYTLGLLFIARIGANLPLPGLNPEPLQAFFADQTASGQGSLLGLYNLFTGGAFVQGAICALGVMPYISASIIFQLMSAVLPSLSRLQQEGEAGRQKLTQYTRYATVIICFIQGTLLILALQNPERLFSGFDSAQYGQIILIDQGWFLFNSIIILTAGTTLLMWLGEQISQNGIGNGISLLLAVGILAEMPSAVMMAARLFSQKVGVEGGLGLPQGILMLLLLVIVVASIVAVSQAERRIPVQYAKRVVGRKIYGGQSSFLPLKVNYAGVMPIIFASAILLFIQQGFSWMSAGLDWSGVRILSNAIQYGSLGYYLLYATLILTFSYFWVSVMFRPLQVADDLKKYGGYIPGVRPGKPTAEFLDFVMTRLTLSGAIFLTVIAIIPDLLLNLYGIPYQVGQFFGGTGMLIIVGVVLDVLRQMETHLLERHYDGFLRKGRIRGRSMANKRPLIDTAEVKNLSRLWMILGVIFSLGIIAWLIQQLGLS